MRPLFAICGKARAGKTTVAKSLARVVQARGVDFTFEETNSVLVEAVAKRAGISPSEVLALKEEYRPELIQLGNAMCEKDPAALARRIFQDGHSIAIGVRRLKELETIRHDFPSVMVIWVERDVPTITDNREIEPENCDLIIDNNGTLADVDEVVSTGLLTRFTSIGTIAADTYIHRVSLGSR